jgi:hypothetical protein
MPWHPFQRSRAPRTRGDLPMESLSEISRAQDVTGCFFVEEDFTEPSLRRYVCRTGVWIGWRCLRSERVVIGYENHPPGQFIGWALNGVTVAYPGSGGIIASPTSVPGEPDVFFQTPVDNIYHRIALSVQPGTPNREVATTALWSTLQDRTIHWGPGASVELAGMQTTWPGKLLDEESVCFQQTINLILPIIERGWPLPPPPPPVRVVREALERVHDPKDVLLVSSVRRVLELKDELGEQAFDSYARQVAGLVVRFMHRGVRQEVSRLPD